MSASESINTIYKVAKTRMKAGEAGNYVGEVISFCINRLSQEGMFSNENLEKALEEEAEFHIKCQSQDVA